MMQWASNRNDNTCTYCVYCRGGNCVEPLIDSDPKMILCDEPIALRQARQVATIAWLNPLSPEGIPDEKPPEPTASKPIQSLAASAGFGLMFVFALYGGATLLRDILRAIRL